MDKVNRFFPKLFSPLNIGRLRLANRIVMSAMGTDFPSATGEVTDTMIAYHAARAKGGAGLIIVEHSNIDYGRGQGGATQLRIDDDGFIPGLHRLVEAVHEWDTRICIQINHVGASGRKTIDGPYAPSGVPISANAPIPKILSASDIRDIIEKFGQAARRAKRAGFDAVEVHGAHVYLIAQFLCPETNNRTDEYGGDLNGRMKFALEAVKSVRSAVGEDFPVLFRLNGDDFSSGGMTLGEAKVVAQALEKASVDVLDVTAGAPSKDLGFSRAAMIEPMSFAQGWRTHLAAGIKSVVSVPVITVGVIREPEFAEKVLQQNKADLIAIGRGLLADPDWPRKAKEGKSDRILKCISCNEGCHTNRAFRGWHIRCTVNAATGRERELAELHPAGQPKRVCVIGGGPSGMECARVAALRGHQVTLYEKQEQCGGQVRFAALPPGKDKLYWLLDYLTNELKFAGVEVHTNSPISLRQIREMKYDAVVVATGGEPMMLEGLSANGMPVTTAHDVFAGKAIVQKEKVVVVGGGPVGCETALYLAEKGNSVTVVEMTDEAACGLPDTSKWDLLNSLSERKVQIMLNAKVLKATDKGVVVANEKGDEELPCTLVVCAVGVRPVNELVSGLQDKVSELYVIGDAKTPGRIIDAIYEGAIIGRRI